MGLNLGRQEKLRRIWSLAIFSALSFHVVILTTAPARAEASDQVNICDLSPEIIDGFIEKTGASNCSQINPDALMWDTLPVELGNSSTQKVIDEVAELNIYGLDLTFLVDTDLNRYDFSKLKRNKDMGIAFTKSGSLSLDSFSSMSQLEFLTISSKEDLSILKPKNSRLASLDRLQNLSTVMLMWNRNLMVEDNAFSALPAIQQVRLFGRNVINTEAAAFTGVPKLRGLPAHFDLKSDSSEAGTWD